MEGVLLIINIFLGKIMTKDKFYLTENDKPVKVDKNVSENLNEFFSKYFSKLWYYNSFRPCVDNAIYHTWKTWILKYRKISSIIEINDRCKGREAFDFSKVDATKIENEIWKPIKRA